MPCIETVWKAINPACLLIPLYHNVPPPWFDIPLGRIQDFESRYMYIYNVINKKSKHLARPVISCDLIKKVTYSFLTNDCVLLIYSALLFYSGLCQGGFNYEIRIKAWPWNTLMLKVVMLQGESAEPLDPPLDPLVPRLKEWQCTMFGLAHNALPHSCRIHVYMFSINRGCPPFFFIAKLIESILLIRIHMMLSREGFLSFFLSMLIESMVSNILWRILP